MSSIAAPAVCVVTGANSGIGRATAVHLGTQGYTTQVECERFTAAPVPITATE